MKKACCWVGISICFCIAAGIITNTLGPKWRRQSAIEQYWFNNVSDTLFESEPRVTSSKLYLRYTSIRT
jgi:hypothetical protein